MDFVVVGFGLGAIGVLYGVAMLGWSTTRWERAAARAGSAEDAAYELAAATHSRVSGQACLFAGGAILLATLGALTASLDDRTGAFLVATTATVAALGLLLWRYLNRTHRPLPRRRGQPAPIAAAPLLATDPPSPLRTIPLRDETDGEEAEADAIGMDESAAGEEAPVDNEEEPEPDGQPALFAPDSGVDERPESDDALVGADVGHERDA